MLLPGSSLVAVLASHGKCLLKFLACRRCLGIYLLLVPSLLQVVCTVVVASVGIAESYVLYVVADERLGARSEVVSRFVHEERMSASDDVYEHRLARPVGAYDGYVLAIEGLEVDRLGHSPLRHACYAFLNAYYPLHVDVCGVSEFRYSRLVAVDEVFPSAIV